MDQLNNCEREREREPECELWFKITTCENEIWRLIDEIKSSPSHVCDDLVAKKFKIYELSLNLQTMCMTFYKDYKNEKTVMAYGLVFKTHEDWMKSKSELEKKNLSVN